MKKQKQTKTAKEFDESDTPIDKALCYLVYAHHYIALSVLPMESKVIIWEAIDNTVKKTLKQVRAKWLKEAGDKWEATRGK